MGKIPKRQQIGLKSWMWGVTDSNLMLPNSFQLSALQHYCCSNSMRQSDATTSTSKTSCSTPVTNSNVWICNSLLCLCSSVQSLLPMHLEESWTLKCRPSVLRCFLVIIIIAVSAGEDSVWGVNDIISDCGNSSPWKNSNNSGNLRRLQRLHR